MDKLIKTDMHGLRSIVAGELKQGMTRAYNYGYFGSVTSVERRGSTVIVYTVENGKAYTTRLKASTGVFIKE